MNWKASIRNSIRTIAETEKFIDKTDVYYASVDHVDEDSRTCDCTLISGTSETPLIGVRLMAEANDGLLRIPTEGSTVYILSSENITPYVDVFSQLDKIFYVAGDFTFLIWSGGLEFAGKKYGGIPFISSPDDSNAGLLKKLNNLENMLNDLATKFNNHTHPVAGVTAGSASVVSAITTTPETTTLTPTQKSDIENPLVQHGDNT